MFSGFLFLVGPGLVVQHVSPLLTIPIELSFQVPPLWLPIQFHVNVPGKTAQMLKTGPLSSIWETAAHPYSNL